MARVLLLGYFGAGNFGDDALLAGWLLRRRAWLEGHGLQVDITVAGELDPLGGFGEGEQVRPLVSRLIPRRQVLRLKCDEYAALIAPGGSLLQDATSLRSLLYYLAVIRRFRRAKVPVYLLNQGIGPLSSLVADWLTPRYLRRVQMLSLRDEDSHGWCQRSRPLKGLPELHLACDPMLDPPFAPLGEAAESPALAEPYALLIPKRTGDLPHPGDATTEPEALGRLVETVARLTGLRTVLLSLHGGQDAGYCEELAGRIPEASLFDAAGYGARRGNAALAVIGGAQLVIGYRLHGLVTAAARGIPALGVAYDPKVQSFCYEMGYPYCFPALVHEQTAREDLKRLWQDRREVLVAVAERRKAGLARLAAVEERFDALW